MTQINDVLNRTRGRWPSILSSLGMEPKFLRNVHGPCPMCGGDDRWRFDDANGTGRWWCNGCGRGDGLDLVMTWKQATRTEAIKLIEGVIGGSRISVRSTISEPEVSDKKVAMKRLWNLTEELDGNDIASRYLVNRGITLKFYSRLALRWANNVPFWHEGTNYGAFPCMLARWVAPDNKASNLLRTYLQEPGRKADLPCGARKMMPGPIPAGGAVRLAEAAEVMGVAEGIETALAAADIFDVPVWATLGTAGLLRFEPPAKCKRLIIFGDRDAKYAGQAAAFALAHRLEMAAAKRPIECEVRVPDSGDPADAFLQNKRDWNDALSARQLPKPPLRVIK